MRRDQPTESSEAPISRRPSSGSGLRVATVSGFEISVDYSWFIVFFLILATFSGAVFPERAPGFSRSTHLVMGGVGTVLFFGSLLLHELAHAFAARRRGVEVEGITLFIFGGMARTRSDPRTPGDEFFIAGVGPLTSLLLAAGLYGVARIAPALSLGLPVVAVAEYLAWLNLLLALFNLFPGFPLDGGRLLRATLWKLSGNLIAATRASTLAGRFLGWSILGFGVWLLVMRGVLVGGLWFIFIGWFLAQAAQSSFQQVLLQELLSPLSARQAMSWNPETVDPEISLEALIHEHFLQGPYNSFPVTRNGQILGLVTLAQVKGIPRDSWGSLRVEEVMTPRDQTLVVDPDLPMMTVMEEMRRTGARRALVARNLELVGILSASDLARWMERATLVEEKVQG
jgi:Zn-dependent protease/CBS domain-containing protein